MQVKIVVNATQVFKVHVFKEGHKNGQNLHRQFDITYAVSDKSTVKISSMFVALLEYTNFNKNPIHMILYIPASMKIAGLYVDFLLPIFITNMGRSCTLLPISITSATFG